MNAWSLPPSVSVTSVVFSSRTPDHVLELALAMGLTTTGVIHRRSMPR